MKSKLCNKILNTTSLITLFLYLTNCSLFSQSSVIEAKEGLELCYKFKWEQAEKYFHNMIKENPNKPDGYHFLSGIYLWYYLGSHEKEDFNNFLIYSDSAIDIAKEILPENKQNVYLYYLLGNNYMYRAVAFTKQENYLDAVWSSKKSESYLLEALELEPKFTDAYLGLGLYNFAVGQIPSAFQWALSLAGIKGDEEVGINYIKKAAVGGNLSKVEAQYYLSQILSEVLFENEAAIYYLNKLVRRYPENLLFNYSYAVLQVKQRNLNDAQRILYKIVYLNEDKFKQIISFSNFLMGDVFFKKNLYDSAIVYYQRFLTSTPTNDYAGIANYRLALSFEMTNDRKKAKTYFNNSRVGNMDLEDDQYAKRKGEIYSQRSLIENEKSLLFSENLIQSGNYKAAYDSLINLLPKIKTLWLKAEVLVNLSEAAYKLKKYDESLNFAEEAKSINSQEEKWISPYSAYYAARVYHKLNDEKKFAEMIDQIDDYTDYDYQNKLKNLVYSISKKNFSIK